MKKNVSIHRERDEAVLRITARYVAQVQESQHPCLADYLVRYPQYANALTDFIAYYHAIEVRLLQNMSVSDLATKLDLSTDIVLQLEQRLIDPGSIPLLLYRRLATALQQPLSVIRAYLAADYSYVSTYSQKRIAEQRSIYSASDNAGTQLQQFRQVVVASKQLSDEQKGNWYKVIAQESI